MALSGCNKSWALFNDFLSTEAPSEIEAFFSERSKDAVRILVMRHAMGNHNTYAGMGSLMSEDAEINETGEAQGDAVAEKLREAGIFHEIHLAVISPFTRALQTALKVIPKELLEGSDGCRALPTIVHPLCAEQTFVHSHVGRGNRGSTVEELSRSPDFSLFDWKEVEAYCETRRVNGGKWWHHGPHHEETESSFQRRALRLKKWLGSLQDEWGSNLNVLLVSHGGVMQAAFDYQPHPPNCSFRVYDLQRTGACKHVARNEEIPLRCQLLNDPRFEVWSVRRLPDKVNGSSVFRVEVSSKDLGEVPVTFFSDMSENVLREKLHDPVKEALSAELYDRYGLAGLFPSWWSWLNRARADLSIYIQDYLEQLALAMGDEDFPQTMADTVWALLLEGRCENEELKETECEDATAGSAAVEANQCEEEEETQAECKVG